MYKMFVAGLFCLAAFNSVAQTCDSVRPVYAWRPADSLLDASLQRYYSQGHFNRFLRQQGIKKLTCAQCEAVWVELVFNINAEGKIVPLKVNASSFCHRETTPAFINRFYRSLQPLTLPLQLAGRCYVYRFGRALKC